MREALAGLTVRGRAFAAAGVTAVVCAILLGQPALTRVGVLLVALPVITAFFVGRSRYRLALVRTVQPQIVPAGQPARVRLTITNEGRTPSGALMLEDQVPYVLGSRPQHLMQIGVTIHNCIRVDAGEAGPKPALTRNRRPGPSMRLSAAQSRDVTWQAGTPARRERLPHYRRGLRGGVRVPEPEPPLART